MTNPTLAVAAVSLVVATREQAREDAAQWSRFAVQHLTEAIDCVSEAQRYHQSAVMTGAADNGETNAMCAITRALRDLRNVMRGHEGEPL